MSETTACRSRALKALVFGALLALTSGGPRPDNRSPEREHTQWGQRVQDPVVNDAQRVQFPSFHDTQQIQFPSLDDGRRCPTGQFLDRSGQFSRCVSCLCNGRSDECEENTGRCLNCRENSAGHHCERCIEGHYLTPDQRRCRPCSCPLSNEANNFAVGCTETHGRLQCLCKDGYMGERCERCAPGFYGDPLVYGCRPCNCPGNLCDSKTGVCRNSLELRDTNTGEQCEECDNCAQTLLADLEKLDADLRRIKDRMDFDSLRPSSKALLRQLEEAIATTRTLVKSYNTSVNSQRPQIAQLEQDVFNLAEDVDALKEQVNRQSVDAQKAFANAENSHQRAKNLDGEAQDLLRKIQELLKRLKDSNSNGASLPSADLAKLLEQAEKMVKEMERRSFTPQKDAAEKEQTEANKFLKDVENIIKQCNENEEESKRLDGLLNNYEAKLKDIEDLLKQANNMVNKASNLNDINAEGLKDILKRVNDLARERDVIRGQIDLATKQLKNTEDLLKMFDDSKTEYERLAAEVNGAQTELTRKVKAVSQAAAKESLVKQAEEHAENMFKLAKELQEAVQNVSGRSGVQDALAAIEAYKNITDAINAAEEAAKKAKEAADKALNDVNKGDLINRAKDLKNNGNSLLKDTKTANKDLKDANKVLNKQKDRVQDAEKKKKALEDDLRKVTDGLNAIQRDGVAKIIDAAKKAAAEANRSTSDTMDQLNGINAEVRKISITPAVSNIDKVLDNVETTVKNLSSSIPSLLDKIDELNSEISSGNNVSENINKIKQLIEQAREAANRILVPMKFTGKGHVELRPPQDVDELRAFTSLSLSLKPEIPAGRGDSRRRRQTQNNNNNLFVLYLGNRDASGDFIGMAQRNKVLRVIYKLNGQEFDFEASDTIESTSDQYFDKIDLYRIYQDIEVNYTTQFTATNLVQKMTQKMGDLTHNLLDLRPENVVFYVGGYPDDFTPPNSLNYRKYNGCIEFSSVNNKFISLYNFKNAVNINLQPPCMRELPSTSSKSEYFEGSGYAKLKIEKFPSKIPILSKIETRAKDALLLFLGDETNDFYYSVSLEEGYLVLRGQEKGKILDPVKSTDKPSLSPEVDVKLYLTLDREITVKINNTDVRMSNISPQRFEHYYIGGIPSTLRERYNISVPALKACVRIGTVGGSTPEVKEKVGVGRGCSNDLLMVRKAEFSQGSSLEKLLEDFSLDDVKVSLGFKSTKADGVLLQNSKNNKNIELSLENRYVVLKFQGNVWRSNKQYLDDKWHYITVVGQGQSAELRIDEEDVGQRVSSSASGPFSSSTVLGKDTFEGCISNVYLRRSGSLYRAEDLSTFSSTGDVRLRTCSV